MTSDELTLLQNIYDKTTEQAFAISRIFLDYYGEDRTELHITGFDETLNYFMDTELTYASMVDYIKKANIIVRFPNVRIENEYGMHIDVEDLWVKVPLYIDKVNYDREYSDDNIRWLLDTSFRMTRSKYKLSHLKVDYMHSHCPGVQWNSEADQWMKCCLGTGPIKNTCATLCSDYDPDIWQLFCIELEKYVETESLSGGPYRKMSSITEKYDKCKQFEENRFGYSTVSASNEKPDCAAFKMFKDFMLYYLKHFDIPMCFKTYSFSIGESYFKFRTHMSRSFIEWFNNETNPWNRAFSISDLLANKVINGPFIIDENTIFSLRKRTIAYMNFSDNSIYEKMEGRYLFTFKGKKIRVSIYNDTIDDETENNACYLISKILTDFVATTLIQFLNMKYHGNQDNQ